MEGVDKGQIPFRVFPSQHASLSSYAGNLTFISSLDTYRIVHESAEISNFSSNNFIYQMGCPITFFDVFLYAQGM